MVRNLLRSSRKFAPSYFDDVFVHSRAMDGQTDVEVHRLHVRKVLTLMREHKLYDSLKKCIFDARETPISGCIVGKHGVRPDPEKIKAITNRPVPTDVKGLRKFLGLAAYLHISLAKFRVYLLGDRPFIFFTDNVSLRTAVNSPLLSQ